MMGKGGNAGGLWSLTREETVWEATVRNRKDLSPISSRDRRMWGVEQLLQEKRHPWEEPEVETACREGLRGWEALFMATGSRESMVSEVREGYEIGLEGTAHLGD